MPWWVWLSLALFGVILLPATIVAVRAMLRLNRASNSLNAELEPRLARLQAQTEDLNVLSARATASTERTKERIAALQISLSRIQTFAWALRDVQAFVGGVRGLVPRK